MNFVVSRKKLLIWSVLATLLSLLVSFLATPILRVLRNVYGSKTYWAMGVFLFGILMFGQLFPIAFMVASVWLVVGIYGELEERGHAGFWNGFVSVIIASICMVVGPLLTSKYLGFDFAAEIRKTIESVLTQLQAANAAGGAESGAAAEPLTTFAGIKIDADFIMSQIPSVIFILQLINLAFALILDRKVAVLMQLPFERIAIQMKTLDFRLPEGFVWVAMLSFLGTFLKLHNPQLTMFASNIFTAMMGLYFFQGLAVLEVAFLVFRTGAFMRFLLYFIVVGQLFFVLSAVGFADYWIDFRRRLKNFRMNKKEPNNGEQV